MAKLLQRIEDGGHYTQMSVGLNRPATYQIHPDGLIYLLQHGVRVGTEIPGSCRRVLWDRKWFYTRGEQPGLLHDEAKGEEFTGDAYDSGIAAVIPMQPSQANAKRPVFLFDRPTSTYFTVLHLNVGDVHTEPTVMCIKYRAAKRLMAEHGAKVGQVLPTGMFEMIFLNRWFYPKPGWTPCAALPLPLTGQSSLSRQDPEQSNFMHM